MTKMDLMKIVIDEIYSKPPKKNYATNKIIYNHIDEIWSIDLADMIDYETSNIKRFRYMFIIIHNFSNYTWCLPFKNKKAQTKPQEFSNFLTTSKRLPLKIKSNRGTEVYNSIFQNFFKVKNTHHYPRFTDQGPSIAERVVRTLKNLFKKPVFQKKANWVLELPSVIKQYNNCIHNSTRMTPVQASKKENGKEV